jgi:hypothetical protein
MNRKLLYPMIRNELKGSIGYFYNFEFQKKWYDSSANHKFWDSLDYYIIDYCYNDFYDDAHEQIGVSLYNAEEADKIQKFLQFFDNTIEGNMTDDYYPNHPKWPKIIEGAKKVVAMLDANEKKYDYEADCRDYASELWSEEVKLMFEDIDNIESWSPEKKQSLKNRMENTTYENFREIAVSVWEEIEKAQAQVDE